MQLVGLLMLAVAISVDGLAAGIAYGLRGIRVPFLSLVTVSTVSALMITTSMQAGRLIGQLMPPLAARLVGSGILIALGTAMLRGGRSSGARGPLILRLVHRPQEADLDRSGTLTPGEAALLGAALALDALGAGLGAGIVGFWAWICPIIVGLAKLVFMGCGVMIGGYLAHEDFLRRTWMVPGGLLIILGILKLV